VKNTGTAGLVDGSTVFDSKGSTFEVVDFYTGKSFFVKRTGGSNHADCETLTVKDTNIMKEIWGGFSW